MYLTPKHSKKKRAHIWDESNQRSVCKLSSTGGLDPGKYHLTETTNGRALCQMCKSVMASKGVDRNLRINGIADTVMHFGKMYRGRLWREVPDDYLRWMAKECPGKLKAIAEKVLRVKRTKPTYPTPLSSLSRKPTTTRRPMPTWLPPRSSRPSWPRAVSLASPSASSASAPGSWMATCCRNV